MSATTKSLLVIPHGKAIKEVTVNGQVQTALVDKKRGGRRHKLSKKIRNSMSAARKRLKLPVLTFGANIIPFMHILGVLRNIFSGTLKAASGVVKGKYLFDAAITPYTGLQLNNFGDTSLVDATFNPSRMVTGLIPNVIVGLVRKFNIFKGINQKLGKIPIRLS